jgi:hypothetical protein
VIKICKFSPMKWYGVKFSAVTANHRIIVVRIAVNIFAEVKWLSHGKVFFVSYNGCFKSDHCIFPIICLHSLKNSIFHGLSATVCCFILNLPPFIQCSTQRRLCDSPMILRYFIRIQGNVDEIIFSKSIS